MSNWITNMDNKEEVSSIASGGVPQAGVSQNETVGTLKPEAPKEAITQLGSSYEIKDVTVSKKSNRSFPTALLVLVVIAPLVFILAMGAISRGGDKVKDKSFIFDTLESKYFTLSVDPAYTTDSVIDKRVPFLERHILTNTTEGQKVLTILVKDVKFDYNVSDNLGAKARKDNPDMYREEEYELSGKKGLYFKKTKENFEHFILLVDRDKNLLYEITMESPTTFATNLDVSTELESMLSKITFL